MKEDIRKYVIMICKKFDLEAIYIPSNDVYSVMRKGRAVMNFNSRQFYEYPRILRTQQFKPLLNGLNQNLGERHKAQFILNRKMGIKIHG